ncbi:MAG: hypothetical protein GX985_00720 [Gallicola sp.]|nr:hypothetical protein [Gallicola sp.]
MEKRIKADLMDGLNSCMRVLVTLRGRNIKPSCIQMDKNELVLCIEENNIEDAFLNLSKLQDVEVSYK